MIYSWGKKIYQYIPPYFRKTAFEWFTSILCLATAIGNFISDEIHSQAVRTSLPHWMVLLWFISLTFGPTVAMVGMVVQTQVTLQNVLFWKKCEALGLSNIVFVGGLYVFALVLANGLNGFIAIMLISALVLTAFVRVIEIYADIDDFRRDINAASN